MTQLGAAGSTRMEKTRVMPKGVDNEFIEYHWVCIRSVCTNPFNFKD